MKKDGKNLTQKAAFTLLNSAVQHSATLIVGFFITPLIVSGLGKELFGVWGIIRQSLSYLLLGDTFVSGILKFTIAREQHNNDDSIKQRLTTTALIQLVIISPFLLLGGIFAAYWAPDILHVSPANSLHVRNAFLFTAISVPLLCLSNVPGSILRGMNQDYRAMGVTAGSILFIGLLNIYAVKMGYGLKGLVIVNTVGAVLAGIIRFVVLVKVVDWFALRKPVKSDFISFLRLGGWSFASSLGAILLNASDVIMVGILWGPSKAAIYTMTGFVIRFMQEPLNQMISSVAPGLTGMYGKADTEGVAKIHVELQSLVIFVLTVVCVPIAIFNEVFIKLWVGHDYFGGNLLNLILIATLLVKQLIRIDSLIALAALDFKNTTLLLFISGVISITCTYLLSLYCDMPVSMAGFLIGQCSLLILYRRYMKLYINRQPIVTNDTLKGIIFLIIMFIVAIFIPPLMVNTLIVGWKSFFIIVLIAGTLTAIMTWVFGLSRNTRKVLSSRIRQIIKC